MPYAGVQPHNGLTHRGIGLHCQGAPQVHGKGRQRAPLLLGVCHEAFLPHARLLGRQRLQGSAMD
eukprot:923249-Rhodomonas_salina.1